MDIFLHVLWNNVLPLSILIGLGIGMQRIFRLDIRTLSKMNFYLFSPALMFDPLALVLHGFETPLPGFVATSVGYLSSAFIGTALFTLGVQLGSMSGGFNEAWTITEQGDFGFATWYHVDSLQHDWG